MGPKRGLTGPTPFDVNIGGPFFIFRECAKSDIGSTRYKKNVYHRNIQKIRDGQNIFFFSIFIVTQKDPVELWVGHF